MDELNKSHITDIERGIEVDFDKVITLPITTDDRDSGVCIYIGLSKIGKWARGPVHDDTLNDLASRISLGDAKGIPDDVWHAFHKVWTWCVGKPGYDKKQFIELERKLLEAARPVSSASSAPE